MPTLGAPLDFAKLEARNLVAHQTNPLPASPVKGQLAMLQSDNTLYYYDGTAWQSAKGGVTVPDATAAVKGIVQLAGDLSGTAAAPVVANGAITSAKILDGTITDTDVAAANKDGVAGTASLRTLGAGAQQAAPGNDARFGSGGPPTGNAGGDLSGTYPNPQIATGVIVDTDVAAANKDGLAATASLRTLGSGAQQAAAGNDARLSDGRAPTGAAGGDLASTYPNPTIGTGKVTSTHILDGTITDVDVAAANKDGAVGTASMRTLGSGAQQSMAGNTRLDQVPIPAGTVNINGFRLMNVLDPTNAQDAATRAYVDNVAQGLDAKASVKAASSANIANPTGAFTVDGVALVVGDRCLLKDQALARDNGIYMVQAGAWVRDADANTWNELVSAYVWVEQGTANADTGWVCTVDQGGTLNTTAVTWVQFSGAGQIIDGAALLKTGNTLDVQVDNSTVEVSADALRVKDLGITNAKLAAASIDLTAKVTGALPIANGGTGQTAQKAARETGLAAAGYYSSAVHGAGTTITVTQATHGLRASRGLTVMTVVEATGAEVIADVVVAATGDVTITFAASQSANSIRTTIIG